MKRGYALVALVLVLNLCAQQARLPGAEKLTPNSIVSGKVAHDSLRKLAPPSGLITDAATLNALCHAWLSDGQERHEIGRNVDFKTELVLVGTVPGPNRVIMHPELHKNGDVRFVVAGTKIGGPGFGFLLMSIDRKGVKSINGTPLNKGHAVESITVTVVGTLKTGVVAIGGETTGTTISAKGVTWELDLGDSAGLHETAEEQNGKPVIVQGSLERRSGVEVKDRWIVHATGLQSIKE